MSTSPVHNYRPKCATKIERAVPLFLTYLNAGTLAFALVVAFALLTGIRGNEPEDKRTNNFNFSPKTLTIPPGTTVTWTNHDNVAHIVTNTDKPLPKSPGVKAERSFCNTGQSWTWIPETSNHPGG